LQKEWIEEDAKSKGLDGNCNFARGCGEECCIVVSFDGGELKEINIKKTALSDRY
jgi:hypothetical protein